MINVNNNINELDHSSSPPTLLEHLEKLQVNRKPVLSTIFKKIPTIVIAIILFIFSVSFTICVILLSRRNYNLKSKTNSRIGRHTSNSRGKRYVRYGRDFKI
jgi:hypothetical protein